MAFVHPTIPVGIQARIAQAQPGLGHADDAKLDREIDGFVLRHGKNPGATAVAEFLRLYAPGAQRDTAARGLLDHGVASAATVAAALNALDAGDRVNWRRIGGVLSVMSAAVSGIHGYRRNRSIAWGAAWFVLGGIFPIFTPVIAVAQGYGKRKDS